VLVRGNQALIHCLRLHGASRTRQWSYPMITRTVLSLAVVAALGLPGIAFGQEEHRIGGKAVPADQMAEVQAKCDEMRKGETPSPVAQAAADEPNAEAGAEAAADAAVELSSELWIEGGERIDVEKLSIELCSEGNFGLSPN
jgi:hypothetical protein